MKKNKRVFLIVLCLALLTAVLAVVYLTARVPDVSGSVLINGEPVSLSLFTYRAVTGTVVNGKGEEKQIDAQGISLAEAVGTDFETATVTASDAYSATVEKDEAESAYLLLSDDGSSLRLVVFGDGNSKRSVKNVVSIDVQ